MKSFIQWMLRYWTRKILKKYKPKVIAVTGSVGKTSTKEAIYTVLSSKFRVQRNIKNYNNEIGLPMTVIGRESPGRSVLGWISVLWHAMMLVLFREKNYPEMLVVEMGADKKGDIKYLVDIALPDVAVITSISESHYEFFGSVEEIYREKTDIIRYLGKDAYAILNVDDENTARSAKETEATVVSFGAESDAEVSALEMIVSGQGMGEKSEVNDIRGVSFKIQSNGSTIPVLLPKVLGKQHVSSALAAAAVGLIYKMNLIEISEALKRYDPPNGRMNLIEGIKHTLIIDDTYNSSPVSVRNALDVTSGIALETGREKFIVLGDMLELGDISEKSHREIGKYIAGLAFDYLMTVGERARDIAISARRAGMPEDRVFKFADAETAGKFLQGRIEEGDLILIKGSQGVRMEKIVKELMAEPLRAKELLVRQDETWLAR
ncbi:MAG TPA: Mur ligase family protein [Patescibacteria group bacterium]|nr:Mur ligase family protein [Patescibacteria group bacterium]